MSVISTENVYYSPTRKKQMVFHFPPRHTNKQKVTWNFGM